MGHCRIVLPGQVENKNKFIAITRQNDDKTVFIDEFILIDLLQGSDMRRP